MSYQALSDVQAFLRRFFPDPYALTQPIADEFGDVYGDIAALQAALANRPEMVVIRAQDGGTIAIGTTATTVASATLAIPATWNTYDIEAHWQCGIQDSSGGTGASNTYTAIVNLAGSQMGQDATMEMTSNNDLDTQHMSGHAYIEGQSTTGNRAMTLTMTRTAGFTANALNRSLIVRAYRVT